MPRRRWVCRRFPRVSPSDGRPRHLDRDQEENAKKLERVLRDFGFDLPELSKDLFLAEGRVIRMGLPPIRIEILTAVSGVQFHQCYASRKTVEIEGVKVDIISLEHLKANKRTAGRHQDFSDLEHLP